MALAKDGADGSVRDPAGRTALEIALPAAPEQKIRALAAVPGLVHEPLASGEGALQWALRQLEGEQDADEQERLTEAALALTDAGARFSPADLERARALGVAGLVEALTQRAR